MSLALSLVVASALAAGPSAKAWHGPLDGVDVSSAAAGVVVRFDKAERKSAEAALTYVARRLGVADALTVTFLRTDQGALAALTLRADGRRLPFGRYTALALQLSQQQVVSEAWAFVAPGARDDQLEQEATWRFERGLEADERRVLYRDDPAWLKGQRTGSLLAFRQARWPDYPLSRLAASVGLPGRGVLDTPWQLPSLPSTPWPQDAGENLALFSVELPGGVSSELQQAALVAKRSSSSLMGEALEQARAAKELATAPEHGQLAPYDDGQPDAERLSRRTVTLYLPAPLVDELEERSAAQGLSLSRLLQYAWRRAHPFKAQR